MMQTRNFINQGACRGHDPRTWDTMTRNGVTSRLGTVIVGDRRIPRFAQITQARLICFSCKVRNDCLEYITEHPNPEGIWAGTMPDERATWRQRSAPGRLS